MGPGPSETGLAEGLVDISRASIGIPQSPISYDWLTLYLPLHLRSYRVPHLRRLQEASTPHLVAIAIGCFQTCAWLAHYWKLFTALARAALRTSEFTRQGIANTAWAFAKLGQLDEMLFAALAGAALLRMSEFNTHNIANTAWAFAKLGQSDKMLFVALEKA